jgi:hypothetical protein
MKPVLAGSERTSPVPATACVRIAMWSGPRTVSTALMRAWENRSDCAVWDEPLYPWWLMHTGMEHPGRDEVLLHHKGDLNLATLTARLAESPSPILYQKHMSHHLLPEVPREWMEGARHAFLVRNPSRMLASLAAKIPNATLQDTGLPQQVELLRWLDDQGHPAPVVIDSDDVLASPRSILSSLCKSLMVPFDEKMLSWPAGSRQSDGAWAPYWYDSVVASTGFGPPANILAMVPERQQAILPACEDLYDELVALRLRP